MSYSPHYTHRVCTKCHVDAFSWDSTVPPHLLTPQPATLQVCLPPKSECADTSTPPCDAHQDVFTKATADWVEYDNHLGWKDEGDKYLTVMCVAMPSGSPL